MADNTQVFKQSNQLFETSAEEAASQGASTPAGAKATGASPDTAKMMSTPAQRVGDKKKKTLQQQQRLTAPKKAPEPSATQAAADKVAKLKTLGGIETQLEGLIQQKLQQASNQDIQKQVVNQQYIQQAAEKQHQEGLTTALQELSQASTPEEWQQAFIKAKTYDPKITKETVNDYFVGTGEHLAASLEQYTPEKITIGDVFEEDQDTLSQYAQELGLTPEDLSSMNMEALEKKIQEVESQEFNRIQEIESELPSAVGARREQLMRELRSLGQAGVTGTEAQYDRIQRDIEEARTIDIAGQEFALKDVLEDDAISDYILSSLTDNTVMEELKAEAPGLADWVVENQEILSQMREEETSQAKAFEDVQKSVSSELAGKEDLASVVAGDRPDYMTEGQWSAYKQKLEDSGAWQAATENKDVALAFKTNPELASTFKDYDKDTIVNLTNLNSVLKKDTGPLNEWLGLEEGEFPTDPDTIAKWGEIKEGMEALQKADPTVYNSLASYPNSLSPLQLNKLAASPKNWPQVETALNRQQELDDMEFGDMVGEVFGEDMDVDSINQRLQTLRRYAKLGHKGSLKEYTKLKKLVGNKLDEKDVGRLQHLMKMGSNIDAALEGNLPDIGEKGKSIEYNPEGMNPGIDLAVDYTSDGNLTESEIESLENLDPKLLDKVSSSSPKFKRAVSAFRDKKAHAARQETIKKTTQNIKDIVNDDKLYNIVWGDSDEFFTSKITYNKVQEVKKVLAEKLKHSSNDTERQIYRQMIRKANRAIDRWEKEEELHSRTVNEGVMDSLSGAGYAGSAYSGREW